MAESCGRWSSIACTERTIGEKSGKLAMNGSRKRDLSSRCLQPICNRLVHGKNGGKAPPNRRVHGWLPAWLSSGPVISLTFTFAVALIGSVDVARNSDEH